MKQENLDTKTGAERGKPTLKQRISSGILAAALFLQLAFAGCAIAPSYEKPPVIKNKYTQFYANLLELQKHQNEMPEFEVNGVIVNAVAGDTFYRKGIYSRDDFPFGSTCNYGGNARYEMASLYEGPGPMARRVVLPIADEENTSFILIYVSKRPSSEYACTLLQCYNTRPGKRYPKKDYGGYPAEEDEYPKTIESNWDSLELILLDKFRGVHEPVGLGTLNCIGTVKDKEERSQTHSIRELFYYYIESAASTEETQKIYDAIVGRGNSVLPQRITELKQEISNELQSQEEARIAEENHAKKKAQQQRIEVEETYKALQRK